MEMRKEVAEKYVRKHEVFQKGYKFDIKLHLICEELLRKSILAEDSMCKCQEARKNIQCMGNCK